MHLEETFVVQNRMQSCMLDVDESILARQIFLYALSIIQDTNIKPRRHSLHNVSTAMKSFTVHKR